MELEGHAYNSMSMTIKCPSGSFVRFPRPLMAPVPESSTADAVDILFVTEVNFSDHHLPKCISLAMGFFSSVEVTEL